MPKCILTFNRHLKWPKQKFTCIINTAMKSETRKIRIISGIQKNKSRIQQRNRKKKKRSKYFSPKPPPIAFEVCGGAQALKFDIDIRVESTHPVKEFFFFCLRKAESTQMFARFPTSDCCYKSNCAE
ncbi:unnamed protein product [Ceratitis capitata]|uniref:(Mediterranean fruit fly) hypothetical protein n=1 Tax=Ceratitis capitata TaxID=7213 RepID=A0A811V6Y6_CERCA|nr:unnamed protein product [Ceratitis capitata]